MLVSRTLNGETVAFEELYLRYQATLARCLRRMLWQPEDVEEVVQMTFIEAFRGLNSFRLDQPFAAWLYGISVRQAANLLRTQRRHCWLRLETDEKLQAVADPRTESGEDGVFRRQQTELLFRAMESLSPRKRIAFSLHELEEMSFVEIAEITGDSPQTIRARVLSARTAVQKQLHRYTRQSTWAWLPKLERES